MTSPTVLTSFFLALMVVAVFSIPIDNEQRVLHRVRRGRGSYSSLGGISTVVDGSSVQAVSTGGNTFVSGFQASQNFLSSAGGGNYLGQQGGQQAAAWAAGAAAAAGFGYNSVASSGAGYPSNVAGYQGFPSYGR